ncbi:MAG: hypothetical protein CR992_01180 [Desulfobacterales bacterium]|nr:MAG: hypothetical protein CR992_01180 [Desulfobacterales bacterium]
MKSCDPNKHVTVFAEKKIKVDKSIDVSNEKRLVVRSYQVRSYQKPIINRSSHNKIFLEGIQDYSVQGYHTNECTAEESKANVASAKASACRVIIPMSVQLKKARQMWLLPKPVLAIKWKGKTATSMSVQRGNGGSFITRRLLKVSK